MERTSRGSFLSHSKLKMLGHLFLLVAALTKLFLIKKISLFQFHSGEEWEEIIFILHAVFLTSGHI